jgi:hypothetical protein
MVGNKASPGKWSEFAGKAGFDELDYDNCHASRMTISTGAGARGDRGWVRVVLMREVMFCGIGRKL